MKEKIKKIAKDLNLSKNIKRIEERIQKDPFAIIYEIYFKHHDDKVQIFLTAYNKEDFLKNDYSNTIKEQINEDKKYFIDQEGNDRKINMNKMEFLKMKDKKVEQDWLNEKIKQVYKKQSFQSAEKNHEYLKNIEVEEYTSYSFDNDYIVFFTAGHNTVSVSILYKNRDIKSETYLKNRNLI